MNVSLYLGWGGGSSKIYLLMFAFDLLYMKEFRRAWICSVVLRRQIKSWQNQIGNKKLSPSVSIWLVYCAHQGWESKDIEIQERLLYAFPDQLGWRSLRPPLICGAHYRLTSFICFNVHISLHTHSKVEDLIWSQAPLRLRCWCFFLSRSFASAP